MTKKRAPLQSITASRVQKSSCESIKHYLSVNDCVDAHQRVFLGTTVCLHAVLCSSVAIQHRVAACENPNEWFSSEVCP